MVMVITLGCVLLKTMALRHWHIKNQTDAENSTIPQIEVSKAKTSVKISKLYSASNILLAECLQRIFCHTLWQEDLTHDLATFTANLQPWIRDILPSVCVYSICDNSNLKWYISRKIFTAQCVLFQNPIKLQLRFNILDKTHSF